MFGKLESANWVNLREERNIRSEIRVSSEIKIEKEVEVDIAEIEKNASGNGIDIWLERSENDQKKDGVNIIWRITTRPSEVAFCISYMIIYNNFSLVESLCCVYLIQTYNFQFMLANEKRQIFENSNLESMHR